MADKTIEQVIDDYPFLNYINEDKTHYKKAREAGYRDDDDLFLIGDSGGFLMNINKDDRFINTYLATEMADFYRANKCYTFFKLGSIPYEKLRRREEYRRRKGIDLPILIRNGKITTVHVSGSMYNYLNYTQMEKLDESSTQASNIVSTGKKIFDFPNFIDAQFWTFAIMDFAVNNGFHLIIDKTRRGGFSYIMAADSANDINNAPKKTVIHVAIDSKYLTKKGGLTDFTIRDLNFLETKTPFKRGVLSTNKENFTLGFKQPNGLVSPKSWDSALFSVSAKNNPDCAIGKDAKKVKVEELSTMDNFDAFMTVTEPAMRTGSYVTGNLFCWGTATSGDMEVFENNFHNPEANHFMPFENVWDKDRRSETCGYFKPYCWGLQGEINGVKAMDSDGNSNIPVALRVAYEERRKKKVESKTFADYVNYLGQYALTPNESFTSATENIFTSEKLLAWEDVLRSDSTYQDIAVDGMLFPDPANPNKVIFKTNKQIQAEGGVHNKDYFDWIQYVPIGKQEHHHGCIRKWFNPIKVPYLNKDGRNIMGVPPGLYSMSYDPVGIDKDNKNITMKNSHNSIKVWMNPTVYNNFTTKLVASYYGRPEKLEEADRIFYYLAIYYNCIGTAGVEVNRGETVKNFRNWHALKYLMKDPVEVWDTKIKESLSSSYGIVIGDGPRKLDGLRLLKEMLYSVVGKDEHGNDIYLFQTIYDYQTILELKKWNPVGNFDRVSEMIIRAIEWQNMNIQAAKQLNDRKKVEEDDNYILTRDWF